MFNTPTKTNPQCRKHTCIVAWNLKLRSAGKGVFISRLLVLLLLLVVTDYVTARHPLEPLDTSSPRATIESFLVLTEEFGRRYSEYRDSPSTATQDTFFQLGDRYGDLLNLSQVPPAAQREVGVESFLLLWEVIARVELPDLKDIPGTSAGQEGGETKSLAYTWHRNHHCPRRGGTPCR
jgi:hypothetical protein